MNTKKLIESNKSSDRIVASTLAEKKAVGEPVTAMEGDTVKLKDGKEYQLMSHPWYSDARDPIAIATGQETVYVMDGMSGQEKEVPITDVVAVMSFEDGDRSLRKVKYDGSSKYGETELVYKS